MCNTSEHHILHNWPFNTNPGDLRVHIIMEQLQSLKSSSSACSYFQLAYILNTAKIYPRENTPLKDLDKNGKVPISNQNKILL